MGRRGPKPLPTNVHLIGGNKSKLTAEQLNNRDGFDPDVKIPKPLSHLLPEAKREWKRLAPLLEKHKLISEEDRSIFALYCQSWARVVEMEKALNQEGIDGLISVTPSGYEQMSAKYQILRSEQKSVEKYSAHFGLSPSSRTRVRASSNSKTDMTDKDDGDNVGKFFSR